MKINKQSATTETPVAEMPDLEIKISKKWYQYSWFIFALTFIIISIIWSKLSINTWDDDAITRYMQVQNGTRNSFVFLESWVRPLFAVIFYLPIHYFGKLGLAVIMSSLTAASGCLLYKSVDKAHPKTAFAIVIFLIFQTFLFGISRDAMTEPLASFLFSLGIYLYYKKKYNWFAIVGSLLPLARTETILLLPIWAVVLVLAKKYWQVLLLGTGMLLWYLGIYIYTGDVIGFFHELLKSGEKVNRYAHNPPGHHFFKYVYVLGPIVFYFMGLGSLISVKNIGKQYFILLQFIAGFLMYVFFSSYFDLGQSGGALRNLITLSPFAALIAFYGFNYWANTISAANKIKPLKKYKNNLNNTVKEDIGVKKLIIVFYSIILLLLAWQMFTNKLMLRQVYDENEKDYTVFNYLLATVVVVLIMLHTRFKKLFPFIVAFLLILQVVFTLSFESPQSHSNSEREVMGKMASVINIPLLKAHKLFCNHPWLYWAAAIDINETIVSDRLNIANLKTVKSGDIVVWENHYTSANYTNTKLAVLENDLSFIPIIYFTNEENTFIGVLFFKDNNNVLATEKIFKALLIQYPDNASLNFYYGRFLLVVKKDYANAIPNLNKALNMDASFIAGYYLRGICELQINQKEQACADFKKAAAAGNPDAKTMLHLYCK